MKSEKELEPESISVTVKCTELVFLETVGRRTRHTTLSVRRVLLSNYGNPECYAVITNNIDVFHMSICLNEKPGLLNKKFKSRQKP